MAELKTKVSNASVTAFIKAVEPEEKRKDTLALLKIFKEATKESPKLWGDSMVGYGTYHYQSERSTQKGDWPLTGFSPRKQNLTVYIMPGFNEYADLLKKLGTHKTSVSCLYIKRLSDIDTAVLTTLIKRSVAEMKKRYPTKKTTAKHRIYTMSFGSVYPLYIAKAKKKGRTKQEVDEIICWLTGYTQKKLERQIDKQTDFETFFKDAPKMNPKRKLITGVVCGVRVEDIKETLMREIRYLDKLVDELARGKNMEKILRK